MKRKIYDTLVDWKKRKRGSEALMIEGARRIGKSYIVEEFGRNEYEKCLLIDFFKAKQEVKDLFENYLEDLDDLFLRLEVLYDVKLIPRKEKGEEGRTLIIFDEVQFCPRARAAIKYLVADGRFDYIETGSLISIKKNVKGIMIPSEEHSIDMYPMDFEEFLWALGNDTLMDYARRQFERREEMGPDIHRMAMDYFRKYLIVGGMPQAVLKFIETKDFREVDEVKRNILKLYRNDINQYADGQETKVSAIFEEIPGQLQRHDRVFRLSSIKDGARMRQYEDAFFWLKDSRIVNCCYNSTSPSIGLKMNEERTTLKCYLGDTGLLLSMAFDDRTIRGEELYKKIILGKLEFNLGMLMENAVAQMLRAAGHELYFYIASSRENAEERMEIDFLISKPVITARHNIIPIEVKSGSRYSLTSLKKCMDKFKSYLSQPVVLHDRDLMDNEGILYVPLYMTPLL